MVEDYKKYYYGRTDMTMLNDEKVYGSLGINLKEVTTIVEGYGSVVLHNSLKKPFRKFELLGNSAQLTTTGKNLLNSNIYAQGYLASVDTGQKISLNTEVKSSTTSMDVSSMVGENISISVQTKEKTGKKYAFTDETDVIINGHFDVGRNTYSKFQNIQVPQNAKKLYFSVTYDVQENTELQVELGANSTPYEPYTGLKPSPSPEYPQEIKSAGKWNEEKQKYEINVKVTGKNLFNHEKAKNVNNWEECHSMPTYKDFPVYVGKGNNFSFSFTENLIAMKSEIVAGVVLVKSSGINKWIYDGGNNFNATYTGIAKEDYIYIRSNKERIHFFVNDIKTLQVEINPVPTEYEPYTEQTLTLTSDRPLTKWDKLVEQGGQYGWLYQSSTKEYFGDNSLELYNNGFYFKLSDKKIKQAEGYCEELKQYVNREENPCIAFNMSANIYAYTLNTQEIYGSTVSETKEYLKTHPLHLVYKTETTEFVPLPQSEQTQIRNLHSYNGTTNITVDSGEVPCGINIEYVVGA